MNPLSLSIHGLNSSTIVQQEFESHWVPISYGLVPHLSKKLSKFPLLFNKNGLGIK